ncbi:MAG: exodeoxyribonuclease VII large subunit [Planctomycetota bacterium]|nr:exodeoxyribonuclease VII large subunit [Planctomycetota bacterium]
MEWLADLGRIVIRFTYDPMLVEEVKSIPGRRWHRDRKFWSIPIESVGEAATLLLPLGFDPSSEVEGLLNGDVEGLAGLAQLVAENSGDSEAMDDGWSVTRLNETVRDAVLSSVPETVWLVGEVLEFDRNRHRDHVFFRIVEKTEGDDTPCATVSAVLFRGNRDRVLSRFEAAETDLVDGLQVRIQVRVDLYVQGGSYQVVVEDIDPAYTLGEIARRRERILAEVRKQGLHDRNLSLPFPQPALRIGVLTSPGSDAWKDLIEELRQSGFSFDVTLVGVHVQGDRAETELLAGLSYFQQRKAQFDALVLIRGGGSRADLMAFDSLPLALAVAKHPLKIVVGIGHQADRSVLDEIAHSEKTPTAAAQHMVQLVSEYWQGVRDQVARIMVGAAHSIHASRLDLKRLDARLIGASELALLENRRALQARGGWLAARAAGHLGEARGVLWALRQRLQADSLRMLARAGESRQRQQQRLQMGALASLRREGERHQARKSRVQGADPRTILSRGFAWVKDESGRTISSSEESLKGSKIEVRLRDGVLDARVEATRIDPSAGLSSRENDG